MIKDWHIYLISFILGSSLAKIGYNYLTSEYWLIMILNSIILIYIQDVNNKKYDDNQ